jgi:hypothetical protein
MSPTVSSGSAASGSLPSSRVIHQSKRPDDSPFASEDELTPPPSQYTPKYFANSNEDANTPGNLSTINSESEEGFDGDSKSSTSVGYETDGPGRDPHIGSRSDSEDEDEDNVAGGTDTGLDAGEVDVANASDRSSTDIDTPIMKKKCQELYCEFTWTELANTIEPIIPIPKPEGTGGQHYNIREMIGLGSNHQDDEDTYRDIFVRHVHCCLHCY